MEKVLTKSIENFENHAFNGVYSVSTSNSLIHSDVTYIEKDGVIILSSHTPEKYFSVWKIKNHGKAVNLLLRAEKDLKRANNRNSAPTLNSMETSYKNYFIEELEEYTAPWDN